MVGSAAGARMFAGSRPATSPSTRSTCEMSTQPQSDVASRSTICVFGLGYVGCVSAACFAARGHTVIGVDANPQKTEFIRDGHGADRRGADRRADRRGGGRGPPHRVSDDPDRGRARQRHHDRLRRHAVRRRWRAVHRVPGAGQPRRSARRWPPRTAGTSSSTAARWSPGPCEGILIPILERTSGKTRRRRLRRVREPRVPARGLQRQGLPRPAQDRRRRERRAQRRRWS